MDKRVTFWNGGFIEVEDFERKSYMAVYENGDRMWFSNPNCFDLNLLYFPVKTKSITKEDATYYNAKKYKMLVSDYSFKTRKLYPFY